MGERALEVCVQERLDTLREAARLHGSCGFTLQDWYDDGANVADLIHPGVNVLDVAGAWGYLEGAADHADLTVMEYLDLLGMSLDERPAIESALREQARGVPGARFWEEFDATVDAIVKATTPKPRRRTSKRRKKPRT